MVGNGLNKDSMDREEEIKQIAYDFTTSKGDCKKLENRILSLFGVVKSLNIPDVVKQSELFKCRNVACNEMTNRDNGTVFCDKHKPYLGI